MTYFDFDPIEGEDILYDIHIDDDYNAFLLEDIKVRNVVLLKNFGEKGFLYKRRWEGDICPHETIKTPSPSSPERSPFFSDDLREEVDEDTNMSIIHRCPDCFGTGFIGGYYPQIELGFRYGDMPDKKIIYEQFGIKLSEDFNSWTLWEPEIKEKDIIVRENGQRFRVENTAYSYWRGHKLHQKMRLLYLDPNDIVYKVTDESINEAIQKYE